MPRAKRKATCVCQLHVGPPRREYALSEATFRAYAADIGADYSAIRTPLIDATRLHFNKFHVYNLLDQYERVLFVDSDILCNTRDNIFNRYDDERYFYILDESNVPGDFVNPYRRQWIASFLAALSTRDAAIEWPRSAVLGHRYLNTGVWIASRRHKAFFKSCLDSLTLPQSTDPGADQTEQTYFNYLLCRERVETQPLAPEWNLMATHNRKRLAGKFIHYAGSAYTMGNSLLNPLLIRHDFNVLRGDRHQIAYREDFGRLFKRLTPRNRALLLTDGDSEGLINDGFFRAFRQIDLVLHPGRASASVSADVPPPEVSIDRLQRRRRTRGGTIALHRGGNRLLKAARGSMDCVYLDGNFDFATMKSLLRASCRALGPRGLLVGTHYINRAMEHEEDGMTLKGENPVQRALDEFARAQSLPLYTTIEASPLWYIVAQGGTGGRRDPARVG